jgi:hypothetical protein
MDWPSHAFPKVYPEDELQKQVKDEIKTNEKH